MKVSHEIPWSEVVSANNLLDVKFPDLENHDSTERYVLKNYRLESDPGLVFEITLASSGSGVWIEAMLFKDSRHVVTLPPRKKIDGEYVFATEDGDIHLNIRPADWKQKARKALFGI